MTSRVWQKLRDVGLAARVAVSGLFDPVVYAEKNADLPRSNFMKTIHYCAYGRKENRAHDQGALSDWLLPRVLSKHLSPVAVRKFARQFSSGSEGSKLAALEKFCIEHGLQPQEYYYHKAYSDQEYDTAFALLANLPMDVSFAHAYKFACKHMKFDRLDAAYEWGLAQLEENRPLTVDFYAALRDISAYFGHRRLPVEALSLKTLRHISSTSHTPSSSRLDDLWTIGFPICPDDSKLFRDILERLPQGLSMAIRNDPSETQHMARGWEAVLNVAVLNMLGPEKRIVCMAQDRAEWIAEAFDKVSSPGIVHLRLLAHNYWRNMPDGRHTYIYVDAYKQIVAAAGTVCSGFYPTVSGLIHDIEHDRVADLPTLSYHSVSSQTRAALHFKESALPGYYTLDRQGYSGWSSWRDRPMPKATSDLPEGEIRSFYNTLRAEFVSGRKTKYRQPDTRWSRPDKPYTLLALQVPDDTVMSLAEIGPREMIEALAARYAGSDRLLIIKPHPFDMSKKTQVLLAAVAASLPDILVSNDSIHDLLDDAAIVVTTNSGVGIEALLRLKPVITTGRSDYRAATYPAGSTAELMQHLDQFEGQGHLAISDLEIMRFLHSYFTVACTKPASGAPHLSPALKTLIAECAVDRALSHGPD